MQVVLKFKLPEEETEARIALNGSNYHSVLWELDQYLRGKVKYAEGISEAEREIYANVRTELNSLMDSHKVEW